MRLLVCGGRDWRDEAPIEQQLKLVRPAVLIEGGGRGADAIARRWAITLGIQLEEYPALWHLYGRSAGPIRNLRMLEDGRPDAVIAFSDGLDHPRSGTRHMCRVALAVGLPVTVVQHGAGGRCFSWDAKTANVGPGAGGA